MDKAAREDLAARVLARSTATETEVLILAEQLALTRFTHENIHQNVASDAVNIRIRVVVDRRCGVAVTTQSDDAGIAAALERALERALELARIAPEDPHWPGLPKPQPAPPASAKAYVAATAQATADMRAGLAGEIFAVSEAASLWGAGYVSTAAVGVTIANSHGLMSSFEGTEALANVKLNGSDATGYGEFSAPDVDALSGTAVAAVAARKARDTAGPRAVEPGAWTVVLEPIALAEMLSYLTEHFSAQAIEEGASFFGWDDIGTKYVSEAVTLLDDWNHPLVPGMPFDYEGVPRKAIKLFDRGAVRNIVTDSRWAARLNRENTGHALPAPNTFGPQPLYTVMEAGTTPVAELIGGIEKGLFISRFWYIRPVDRRRTIVTGMTRDGTYFIQDGKLAGGVHNLRFNQSILEALSAVTLGDTLVRTTGMGYTMALPAIKIPEFHFTSATSF